MSLIVSPDSGHLQVCGLPVADETALSHAVSISADTRHPQLCSSLETHTCLTPVSISPDTRHLQLGCPPKTNTPISHLSVAISADTGHLQLRGSPVAHTPVTLLTPSFPA